MYVADLDENCFDVCELDDVMRNVETSISRHILAEENVIDKVGNEEENYIILKVGDTVNTYLVKCLRCQIIGMTLLLTITRASLI